MAIVDGQIRCGKCGVAKPLCEYIPSASKKGSGSCRPCWLAYTREWSRKNPHKSREAYQRWRERRSPEEIRETNRVARERAKADGSRRGWIIKSKYGLLPAEFDRLMEEQGGVCAICEKPPAQGKHLYVDHDHVTRGVRGLLCQKCNTGIGMFGDDAEVMRRAVGYIDESRGRSRGSGPRLRFNLLQGGPQWHSAEGA